VSPSSRSSRRWASRLGAVLLLAGLAVLGYVLWQLVGSTWVSERRHRETVDALEEQWREPGASAEVRTDHGTADAVVRIPAFGDDYAVPVLAGVGDDALASGFGRFDESEDPGDVGNYALAGHRVTHGEPLHDMDELEPGDEVVVETRDEVFTYVLDTAGDDLRVPFTSTWVVDDAPVNPDSGVGPAAGEDRLLTLTTCAELFHTDDRWVAFGHLESVERRR
jgi:sortase A